MIQDGMILYHGSFAEVETIDLGKCRKGLDFGLGFYLTSSEEQAFSFVPSAVRKAVRTKKLPPDFDMRDGRVNLYRFHLDPNLFIHQFEDADLNWLHFVAANRRADLFPRLLEKFTTADIIVGKIADDNTARTLSAYVDGFWGIPGMAEADEITLKMLLPNRLKDQFCFRTADAVATLEFIGSKRYGDAR